MVVQEADPAAKGQGTDVDADPTSQAEVRPGGAEGGVTGPDGSATGPDGTLILDELRDHLQQFRLLYDSGDAATDRFLNQLGGSGRVEREMVRELAATRPIAIPERLFEAHAVAMRALEVLARNGARAPSQLKLGPLTGPARFFVQKVIQYIVRKFQSQVIDSVRDLYARRLGWLPPNDPSRMTMIRARLDVERSMPAFKKSAGGVPAFLVGGAAVSSVTQVTRSFASAAAGSRVGVIVAVIASSLLLGAASWTILRGAAVARRRIQLAMDRPLAALWETIGWCGKPPKDSSKPFAIVAIALTIGGWLLLPLGAVALFTIF